MYKIAPLFVLLAVALMATTVTASTVEQYEWDISDGWFGYPVADSVGFGSGICVVSSDNYEYASHFKAVGGQGGSLTSGFDVPQQEHKDTQAWYYDGVDWVLGENLGNRLLSNIVEYKDNLYVSVKTTNVTSAIFEYNGAEWNEMNRTVGWNVHDMIVFDDALFVVGNGTSNIMTFNGYAWKNPTWDNITYGIESLAVYNDEIYIKTENNHMYKGSGSNLTEMDVPSFGVFPSPFTIFDSKMYCAYRNTIYSYDGTNWMLVKVMDALYYVSTMYNDGDTLFIGAKTIPYDNETRVFMWDGTTLKESHIAGSIVYTLVDYQGTIYAGTDLGLYSLKVTQVIEQSRITYALWASFILGFILLMFTFSTYCEGFDDCLLFGASFAFFSIDIMLLAMPSLYLSYVIFLVPIVVFIVVSIALNYILDTRYDLRYEDKDLRILAMTLAILLIIEISTQVFSKAVGL